MKWNFEVIVASAGFDLSAYRILVKECEEVLLKENGEIYAFDMGIGLESPYIIKSNEDLVNVVGEILVTHYGF